MTQEQLEFAVAHATGESLDEIRRRGFSMLDSIEAGFEPADEDYGPRIVDWDELATQRLGLFS